MAYTGTSDATKVLSVYSSGYGVGPNVGLQREDLLDLITNIDPWDNIVFAMLPKRRAKSTTHEWPVDTLPTAGRSGVADGAAFEAQGFQAPYRLRNFTQIFRWDVSVTGTEQEVVVAGINEKLAYQVLNGTHAIAKAVEQRIFDIGTGSAATGTFNVSGVTTGLTSFAGYSPGSTAVPGYGGPPGVGASNAARLMAPLFQLLPSSGLPSAWTYPIADMASATLTAVKVDDVCEIMFNNGLSPETIVLHPGVKRDLSNDLIGGSTSNALNTRLIQASERKVIRGVDIYEGELCNLSVVPNRSIAIPPAGTHGYGFTWILQKDKLGIAFLRTIKAVPIAKRGDSDDTMVIGELTLELLHPVGAGAVARCIT